MDLQTYRKWNEFKNNPSVISPVNEHIIKFGKKDRKRVYLCEVCKTNPNKTEEVYHTTDGSIYKEQFIYIT